LKHAQMADPCFGDIGSAVPMASRSPTAHYGCPHLKRSQLSRYFKHAIGLTPTANKHEAQKESGGT